MPIGGELSEYLFPSRSAEEMQMKPSSAFWRRKFYVHPIQRKYFFLSLVPLVVCGFLLVFLVLFPLHMTLWGTGTEPEKAVILTQIQSLSVPIMLALLISMLISSIMSFFVTHRLGGPLYRIEQILHEVEAGRLPTAVRIRRDDDLQDFAGLFDRAFKTISSAMTAVTEHQAHAAKELAELHRKVKAELDGEVVQGLEEVGRSHREVQHILENFKLPSLQAPKQESTE
jgi:HAMP domain-containing protein